MNCLQYEPSCDHAKTQLCAKYLHHIGHLSCATCHSTSTTLGTYHAQHVTVPAPHWALIMHNMSQYLHHTGHLSCATCHSTCTTLGHLSCATCHSTSTTLGHLSCATCHSTSTTLGTYHAQHVTVPATHWALIMHNMSQYLHHAGTLIMRNMSQYLHHARALIMCNMSQYQHHAGTLIMCNM